MVQASGEYEIQQDFPQAIQLLSEMNNNVKQVSDLVEMMLRKVKTGELSTEYGLSFLEVKYHMLLNYLINLTYVVLRKCLGQTIEKDPAIDRLIEIRTVLEKIRPIDNKLRYQIDKLVKTAITGAANSTDPILFKPNLKNLVSNLPTEGTSASRETSENDSEDEDDENQLSTKNKKKQKSSKVAPYVPPKLSAVHYEEESKMERDQKLIEQAKKRALTSSMINDLKEEYLDIPVEVSSSSRAQQILSKAEKEREEYEETYLTRLPTTKAEKHRRRKLTTLGTLADEITNFGDLKSLEKDLPGEGGKNKRKRKSGGKKKSGKKRRFH